MPKGMMARHTAALKEPELPGDRDLERSDRAASGFAGVTVSSNRQGVEVFSWRAVYPTGTGTGRNKTAVKNASSYTTALSAARARKDFINNGMQYAAVAAASGAGGTGGVGDAFGGVGGVDHAGGRAGKGPGVVQSRRGGPRKLQEKPRYEMIDNRPTGRRRCSYNCWCPQSEWPPEGGSACKKHREIMKQAQK